MTKECTKCKITKPQDQFYRTNSWCKNCFSEYSREWYQRNKDVILPKAAEYRKNNSEVIKEKSIEYGRKYNAKPETKKKLKIRNLYKRYGITLDEYLALCEAQHHCCKICNVSKEELGTSGLVVDHDHPSGKIRGVLCNNCNTLLGYAKDNIQILLQSIDYLNNSNK